MAKIDFDRAVRMVRLGQTGTLARRPDAELPFLGENDVEAGTPVLLDTTVYIDGLQGAVPKIVWDLVDLRVVHHSTIAVTELMHAVGRLDPAHPNTGSAIAGIRTIVTAMPDHRLHTPDADVLSRAAVLAGLLARLQGYAKDDRFRALHDCALYLQALKLGLAVVTRNVRDYDLLLQLIPAGRVVLYRHARS